jgi:hypothetical protein
LHFSIEEVVARHDRPYLMFGVIVRYADGSLEMLAAFNSEAQAHEYLNWFETRVRDRQSSISRPHSKASKQH